VGLPYRRPKKRGVEKVSPLDLSYPHNCLTVGGGGPANRRVKASSPPGDCWEKKKARGTTKAETILTR